MATIIKEKEYWCTDDCIQCGCPKHTAKLTFQSTALVYTFEDGQGGEYFFDDAKLQVLIDLIKSLNRVDIVEV